MHSYDLTGQRFEELDFAEAVVRLDYSAMPSETMKFWVWGLIFHLELYPLDQVVLPDQVDPSSRAYLPSWATVEVGGVAKVELSVGLYNPDFAGGGVLSRDADGQPLEISREWIYPYQTGNLVEYRSDCVVDHPYGYGSLLIHASGRVSLYFEPQSLVSLTAYQTDPLTFGWWGNGRLRR